MDTAEQNLPALDSTLRYPPDWAACKLVSIPFNPTSFINALNCEADTASA
jgi:hypothetical protein